MTIEAPWLEPGERLLWSDQPHPTNFAWQKGLGLFLFGTAVACTFLGAAYIAYPRGGRDFFWSCAFVVAGLLLLWTPAFWLREARRTTYALTDRRALIIVAGFAGYHRNVWLHQVNIIESTPSDATNTGNIYYLKIVHDEGSTREGFIAVRNFENVERLLRPIVERSRQSRLRVVS